MFTFLGTSQIHYPILDKDSLGNKIVVISYEQAQKVDNNLELLELLEKAGAECDSLNMSYIKVIDEYKRQVGLFEIDVRKLKEQLLDKDSQISNLQTRLSNTEQLNSDCETQKGLKDEEIKTLKSDLKKMKCRRNIGYGVGVFGVIAGTLIVIFK
jgi:predicted RNase H-like nuclease (RuvC/YqgF family)